MKKIDKQTVNDSDRNNLGRLIKLRRLLLSLTLRDLSALASISASHLGRIERGDRFPSAKILKNIAQPLGFTENELFSLVGYLSLPTTDIENGSTGSHLLAPQISLMLSHEPVEIQQAIIGVLTILKSIARSIKEEEE